MAKYDIKHVCGHTSVKQLFGPDRGRQATIKRLETVPCWDCVRLIEIDQAEAHAERHGLPELIGSDKQISWALVLRHKSLVMIERVRAAHDWPADAPIAIPDAVAFAPGETTTSAALVAQLRRQDAATWWIDHARQVTEAGTPLNMMTGRGGISERAFVVQLFRDCVGLDRPTIDQMVNSGDPMTMMRAVVGHESRRERARRSG